MAVKRKKMQAVVFCAGKTKDAPCPYGCIGCGACERACHLSAVHVENSVAKVDPKKCVGCGLCGKACPKKIIHLVPAQNSIRVLCSNEEAAKQALASCKNACIACGICEKNCPAGAVHVVDFHAVIDQDKCLACGMCAVKCPRHVIHDVDGIFAAK